MKNKQKSREEKWNENVEECEGCGIKWKKINQQCPVCFATNKTQNSREEIRSRYDNNI